MASLAAPVLEPSTGSDQPRASSGDGKDAPSASNEADAFPPRRPEREIQRIRGIANLATRQEQLSDATTSAAFTTAAAPAL